MIRLLNWLVGKKDKRGYCRWWNHQRYIFNRFTDSRGTGKYIDGHEITKKEKMLHIKCRHCPLQEYHEAFDPSKYF